MGINVEWDVEQAHDVMGTKKINKSNKYFGSAQGGSIVTFFFFKNHEVFKLYVNTINTKVTKNSIVSESETATRRTSES